MALTIRDMLGLPSLSMAQVVAGQGGLDTAVDSVSVLEWMDLKSFQRQFFVQNEIVITSFYAFRHDVPAQLTAIRRLKESGEVGMILYYVGVILPRLDPRVIRLADALQFPILMMPPNRMEFRYSEAIADISERIRRNRLGDNNFVQNTLERLAGVPEMHRTISTVLNMLSNQLQMTLILTDGHYGEYVAAAWPPAQGIPVRAMLDGYLASQDVGEGYSVVGVYPVSNTRWQHARLLAIAQQNAPGQREHAAMAAQVLELTLKLWKSYEFDNYSADLISAAINNEETELKRLLKRRGQSGFPYTTLWVIAVPGREDHYEQRSLLLASAYRRLLTSLEKDRLQGHLAVFDGYIIGILGAVAPDYLPGLLAGQGLMGAQIFSLASPKHFHQSFLRTLDVMDMAALVYPDKACVSPQELRFLEALKECRDKGQESVEEALSVLAPLREGSDKESSMLITLGCYLLDCGGSMEETAGRLYLHRNTIKYRLQKMEHLLGFSLTALPGSMALYKALALLRLQGNVPGNRG